MSSQVSVTFRRIGVFAVYRKLDVLIDGQRRLTLKYGENAVAELEPGMHVVHTSMDWCSSNRLQINCRPGEAKFIDCGSQPLVAATLYCFVAPGRVFLVREATGDPKRAS